MTEITRLSAVTMAAEIRRGAIGAREALEASLSKIDDLDTTLRAFINVDATGARKAADACDRAEAGSARPLHGIPIAVKDLTDTAGLVTTYGSALYRNNVPIHDELSVGRLRAAGAVIVGKTNTPEFGFGAVCANRLCGPTANPWDTKLTSGGSSGGSAVAATTGMVPLAQGTDFGGSVRTPASFCGCVGLRPTPGVIPEPSRPLAWGSLATQGVLARSVDDAALMLRVMGGPQRDDPTSRTPALTFAARETRLRLAASPDMNGAFRIDPDVRAAFATSVDGAAGVFGGVDEAAPDVAEASDAFKLLRAAETWFKSGNLAETHEHELTDSFVWNVRQGKTIRAESYLRAEMVRSRTYRAFQAFFDRYDILMLPSASVLPFPNAQGEVRTVDGAPCETIIDYLACTYLVSLVGFPTLALPSLWTSGGLPFGVQLVARPYHEATLLEAARCLETGAGFHHRWPDANA